MQNTKTKTANKTATVKQPTLQIANGEEVTYAQLWQFINTQAAGSLHNVHVVPLSNVKLDDAKPVPFGYGGAGTGVRATIQNWLLKGFEGNTSLQAILTQASKLGHSAKKPNCLHALLNGGYSPSSATWGTGYVKLGVLPAVK